MLTVFLKNILKKQKTHFYRDCSELFVFNFHKIAETKNYSWLVVGYDGRNDVKFDIDEALKVWSKIYNEFCKLIGDNKTIMYYDLFLHLGELKVRKYYVISLLNQLDLFNKAEETVDLYIDALSKWRFFIDKDKPLDVELKKMRRQLRAADNKIGLIESELKEINEDEEEPMSLAKQKIRLVQALGRNDIDVKKTTLEEWHYMIEEVKEINEQRNKNRAA